MATSRSDIKRWLEQGQAQGATHTIIVCDTYDYEDYPVHVMPGQDVYKVYAANNGPNMTKAMEVYSHAMDYEKQLNEHRAHNF